MRRIVCFIICLSIGCICSIGYAAPPLPFLTNVTLKANITRDAQGIFTYGYEITNGGDSIGDLIRFSVDISKPANGIQLSNEGLANAPKHIIGRGVLTMPTTVKMVPVSFPSVPDGWLAGPTAVGTAKWGAFKLKPGTSATGFVLQSWGIPTIRDFRAEPEFDTQLMKYYPDVETLPDEEVEKVDEQLKKDREAIAYKGKTIGPTAPPKEFKPLEFIAYIMSLKHQAYDLGWIVQGKESNKGKKEDGEKGIMKSLDQKLSKSRERLEKGDNKEAVEKLKSFIHEVEALYKEDKDKNDRKDRKDSKEGEEEEHHEHLTSEAYALLKYNAQYLIDQLGGEKKESNVKKD